MEAVADGDEYDGGGGKGCGSGGVVATATVLSGGVGTVGRRSRSMALNSARRAKAYLPAELVEEPQTHLE